MDTEEMTALDETQHSRDARGGRARDAHGIKPRAALPVFVGAVRDYRADSIAGF
jgi:hypothetical protein